jgi:hypothetical protein
VTSAFNSVGDEEQVERRPLAVEFEFPGQLDRAWLVFFQGRNDGGPCLRLSPSIASSAASALRRPAETDVIRPRHMFSELKSLKRSATVAIAVACALIVLLAIGAWRSGVEVFVTALVVVVSPVCGWALIAIPDRQRAQLAGPTDLFRGSAQLDARGLRKTEAFREEFKRSRTWLLIYGWACGDLCVSLDGISWRPGRNARRKRVPGVQVSWESVRDIKIIVEEGIRQPAWVFVNLLNDTSIMFVINRCRDLEAGLKKRKIVKWEVVGGQ